MRILLIVGALIALLLPSVAPANCLPRPMAPGQFRNTPSKWGMDSGPILNGFLSLRGARGEVNIRHGVDLSHHNQRVPYETLKSCGTEFAIIKVDDAFALHRVAMNRLGIPVMPYFYLSVSSPSVGDLKQQPGRFADGLGGTSQEALLAIAENIGRDKARAFLTDYNRKVPKEVRAFDLGGLSGQVVVIDVEETLRVDRLTPAQGKNFGRFYARMLSTWISNVRAALPKTVFVFYTFPAVYTDYLQFALPTDHAVIHGMPVWLARTRGDGSDFDLKTDKNLQRLCLSASGGNRCILHQYSHRVIFGNAPWPKKGYPTHIDVDRLFPVQPKKDGKSIQYVRMD